MTRLIRARWLQVVGVAAGVALVAALLVGVSPYPTEVLGQSPPPTGSPPSVTYRCEGGTLVVTVGVAGIPGVIEGFVRESRVPLGSSFFCQFILSILSGGSGSLFGGPVAPAPALAWASPMSPVHLPTA